MLRTKRYLWKGKCVSEKVYRQRISQCEAGKKRSHKATVTPAPEENSETLAESDKENSEDVPAGEGRRIVDLHYLGQQLWCVSCKECLSLENIEHEFRRGLGSILMVRCHKCLLMNPITTGKQHSFPGMSRTNSRFDINTKLVIGMMHSGIGFNNLQKLLSCLNIPAICFKTYKRYEAEVGGSLEEVARKSCENAAELERKLTLENATNIKETLPESMKASLELPETISASEKEPPTTFDDVVRVMASYDMGWSKRGTGRDYDSLNGFGCLVGVFSRQILEYSTCNRKCKSCELGNSPFNHDCRLNFWGSAKAMEAHVANKLVNESSILKSKNIEIVVLIGDDDSSAISACRAGASHSIGKLSDVNHTSKGVKKELFNIEKKYKELTKDAISYLHRCFTYAMAQNKGNSTAMADAVRSIPYHAFNKHEKCGIWCGYVQDKENYDHKIVPGGFSDEKLFYDLKSIFEKLASNADKFSVGVSSNINESLNASMASKAQKSKCLSLSASADFRYSCVVAQKNLGENYTQIVAKKLSLSPGRHHSTFIRKRQRESEYRTQLINSYKFKKRRMELKKQRSVLRHRREKTEGVMYQSNCALLSEPAVQQSETFSDEGTINELIPIVYLDLETANLKRNTEILQIAAKCGQLIFDIYITPTQDISAAASAVNGLRKIQAELFLNGKKVESISLRIALSELLNWLTSFKKKVFIATHNLNFDGPRLFDSINRCGLSEDFSNVIEGFIDTLTVIRGHTNRKGKGTCTLTGLAEWLDISSNNAHNAIKDVIILEKIIKKCGVTYEKLNEASVTYTESVQKWILDGEIQNKLPTLEPLKSVIGLDLRKKMIKASITIDDLRHTHLKSGSYGVKNLLSKREENKALVTAHKPTIKKIIEWLENL